MCGHVSGRRTATAAINTSVKLNALQRYGYTMGPSWDIFTIDGTSCAVRHTHGTTLKAGALGALRGQQGQCV